VIKSVLTKCINLNYQISSKGIHSFYDTPVPDMWLKYNEKYIDMNLKNWYESKELILKILKIKTAVGSRHTEPDAATML